MKKNKEIWKDIKGFNSLYQVSNLGNVKNKKRNKPLTPSDNGLGYLQIKLYDKNKQKSKLVHRLVIETFLGNSDLQANHIDGNKHNNRLSNLEYCTPSENMKHAYSLKLCDKNGTNNGRHKLNKNDIKEIRTLLKNKIKGYLIAEMYEVTPTTISNLKNGRTYKNEKEI